MMGPNLGDISEPVQWPWPAQNSTDLSVSEREVLELRRKYSAKWRDRDEHYWMERLMQEVGELASALAGDHDDPPEWELKQIAAICINWLEMRTEKLNE